MTKTAFAINRDNTALVRWIYIIPCIVGFISLMVQVFSNNFVFNTIVWAAVTIPYAICCLLYIYIYWGDSSKSISLLTVFCGLGFCVYREIWLWSFLQPSHLSLYFFYIFEMVVLILTGCAVFYDFSFTVRRVQHDDLVMDLCLMYFGLASFCILIFNQAILTHMQMAGLYFLRVFVALFVLIAMVFLNVLWTAQYKGHLLEGLGRFGSIVSIACFLYFNYQQFIATDLALAEVYGIRSYISLDIGSIILMLTVMIYQKLSNEELISYQRVFLSSLLLGAIINMLALPIGWVVCQLYNIPINSELLVAVGCVNIITLAFRMYMQLYKTSHQKRDFEAQSYTDYLTHFVNRRGIFKRVQHTHHPYMTIMIDINDYKAVNDTYGHSSGDRLLINFGDEISHVCKRYQFDTPTVIGRLGGDEFCLLVYQQVNREHFMRHLFKQMPEWFQISGQRIFVSFSVGMSSTLYNLETQLRESMYALHEAKRIKKHQIPVEKINWSGLGDRQNTRQQVLAALNAGQCKIHYQPIFNATTAKLYAYETMVYLMIDGELKPPSDFMSIISESDMERDLVALVLSKIQALAFPHNQYLVLVNINLNIFANNATYTWLISEFKARQLTPDRLAILITEYELVSCEQVAGNMKHLLHVGYQVGVNNFGKGAATMEHISSFPIHVVKIDPSMLDEAMLTTSIILLNSMISMVRSVNAQVVISGIQNITQLELARSLSVDYIQGDFLGAPIDFEQLAVLPD